MFLDIAFGILVAILWDATGFYSLTPWSLVVAICFALLPDTDGIISVIARIGRGSKLIDQFSHEHREMFHHPVLYIAFGSATVAVITMSPVTALMFIMLSLLHFAHDSIGIGWGLRWGSPWSRVAYKWFCDQDGSFAWKIARWTPKEQRIVASKKGDPNWVRNIYLRPSLVSIIETGGFAGALILLWRYW